MDGNLREQNFDELIGMFSQAPIGLCCFDKTLRFVFINDYLAALNGISVEEHLGRSIREVIPDVAAGVEEQLRQVFETGEPIIGGTVDAETPAHPGRIRSFQHHYYAIKSETGTVSRVACVVQEVTARKSAEEALDRARGELERRVAERTSEWREANAALQHEIAERRRAQDWYEALLHAAPDPIVTVDRDGEIVMVSRQVERVLGYGSEELIGQSVDTLLPEHLRGRHVRHRNDYSGNPRVRPMGPRLELVARCKDGRELPVEISLSPVQTTEGVFVTTVIRDITDRRHAEEVLRESKQRFKDFANTASDWFWETDAEHRFTSFSGESEFLVDHLTEVDAGKTRFDMRIPEDTDDAKWDAHRADLDTRRPFKNFQFTTRRADGAIHHVRISGKPIWSAGGDFRGYRGTASDITDFVEADERARSAQERLAIAIEGLSETFLLFDAEDRLVISNRTWREFNRAVADQTQPGALFEDILRAQIHVGLIPEARGQEEKWLRERLERHRNPKEPFEMARPEGRWLLIEDNTLPDGGVITVATDITQLKRSEEALRESEARAEQAHTRLVDAIESLHEGFMMLDSDDRLVMSNKRLLEMYAKLAHLYVPGTTYEDITRGVAESGLVPEARGREDEWIRERIEHYKNPGPPFERQLGPDLWMLTSERKTSEGGTVTVVTDITEMKRVELVMQETKERFRRLLETTNAIPWEADARTWVFTYVGPQVVGLLGYPLERWLETDFWVDHIHPEDRAWAVDYCLNAANQNDNYEFDYRMIAADGRSVWLRDIVNVVRQDGAPVVLRGFMIDVTEGKRTEESLRGLSARLINAQEEERSRIARELHDDFNQRLAILAMDIEQLAGQRPAADKDFSDRVESLLQHTKELSSDIHRLSHQLHPSVLQHLGLVAATRSLCKDLSNQHAIHIELVHQGVPRSLPGDVALCLYRVVQEALRNVIKHSGADSARVELGGTAKELTLQLSDHGTGFDPESAQSRQGLGLLSMRERLRLVSGTISFERVEPSGTRIDVRIPLPDSDQQ